MEFREATQNDLDCVSDHTISRGIQKRLPHRIEYVYALEHEGKVLGVGGFRLVNLTTAWCWIDLAESAKKHIMPVYRVIKEWMHIFCTEHQIRRLQAYVEPDFPQAIRTATHLGFFKESVMRNFMGDKDAYMFVYLMG